MRKSRRPTTRQKKNWVTRHPVLAGGLLLPVISGMIVGLAQLGVEYGWFADAQNSAPSTTSTSAPAPTSAPRKTSTSAPSPAPAPNKTSTSAPTPDNGPDNGPDNSPGAGPATLGPAEPAQVLSHGHAVLVPVDGLDLDTGAQGGQNVLGMDISPSGDGKQINGMTNGKPKMAVVTASQPTGPELCDTIPLNAWVTPLPGLYGMRVGERICVQTDRGNYGVITLRVVPSAGAVNLDIDFIAWVR